MNFGNIILKQFSMLLDNKKQALFYAIFLSVIPFAIWVSILIVSIVTLRKGAKSGFDIFLPAMVIHTIPLVLLLPTSSAIVNTLIAYLPCYLAAIVLRATGKWQYVCGLFFCLGVVGCLLVQMLIPEFIPLQYKQITSVLNQYQVMNVTTMEQVTDYAQLFFGFQILTVILFGLILIVVARFIQSKLFFAEGFKSEYLAFRSDRLSSVILLIVSYGAYREIPIMINLLPSVLCYFLVSGFNLIHLIFSKNSKYTTGSMLILIAFLKPLFVLSSYILIGVIDSLFNLKMYIPEKIKKSI